jgi:hypothetical protein
MTQHMFSDLISRWANFFYDQVHHSPEIAVFGLEEFCDGKKNVRCLRLQQGRALERVGSPVIALKADKASHGTYLRESVPLVAEVQELRDHLTRQFDYKQNSYQER